MNGRAGEMFIAMLTGYDEHARRGVGRPGKADRQRPSADAVTDRLLMDDWHWLH